MVAADSFEAESLPVSLFADSWAVDRVGLIVARADLTVDVREHASHVKM